MTDPVSAARSARENLAQGLAALQTPGVPPQLGDVAEPVAEAMSALHRIESTHGGALGEAGPVALAAVRRALSLLQAQSASHPAVNQAVEAVAGSLGLVHGLTQAAPAAPQPPMAAPPAPQPQMPPQMAPQPQMPPQAPQAAPAPGLGGTVVMDDNQGGAMPATQPSYRGAAPQQPPPAQPQQAYPQQAPQAFPQQAAPAAQQPGFAAPSAQQPYGAPPGQWQPAAAPAAAPAAWPPQQPAPAQPAAQPSAGPPSNGSTLRVEAALGAHSATNFYKGLSGNDVIDSGGIFIATYQLPQIGQDVVIKVSLPGGYEFEARAVVRWTRDAPNSGADSSPGFGAQFTQISPEGRQLVYRYVRNREPLFHDDL